VLHLEQVIPLQLALAEPEEQQVVPMLVEIMELHLNSPQ
jgi:hypothetical protein